MALRALGLENLSSCFGGHGSEEEVGAAVVLLLASAESEGGLVLVSQAFLREVRGLGRSKVKNVASKTPSGQ